MESSQVATSPCCYRDSPGVISANLSPDAWSPTPTVPPSAFACFFLGVIGLPKTLYRSASRRYPRTRFFYRYANGAWIERTELPPDRNYIDPCGSDFDDDSNDLTRKRMAGLIEEAAKANAPAGSNPRKIADFYHSYMDEEWI